MKIRDDVDKLRVVCFERFGKLIAVNAFGSEVNRQNDWIIKMKTLESRQIARVLHHDFITGVDHDGGKQVQRLLRTVCNNDLFRGEINILLFFITLTDILPERQVALC